MAIVQEGHGDQQEFVLRLDNRRRGFLSFTVPGDGVMRIEYVEVDPDLRGAGYGRQLVEAAVAFAKTRQLRVVPICGYARAVIQRSPELAVSLR
jgi:predicted GNAT family acetyltransferase